MAHRRALVNHGITPPVMLNGKAPRYSASTVKNYKACPRQHYYEQVCGLEVPGTQATETGTAVHKIVEEHLKQVPEHQRTVTDLSLLKIARSGFPHLPDSKLSDQPAGTRLLIEESMSIATWPNGPQFTGTPDLLMVRPDRHAHLYDHKTTSGYVTGVKNGWVLTPATLPHDPQAITYSMFAFRLLDVDSVTAKWIYYDKKGKPAVPVHAVMTKSETERKWRDLILPVIGDMHDQHMNRATLNAADVERKGVTNNTCGAYGGCPHRAYCRDTYSGNNSAAGTETKEENNMDLAARLKAQAQGATPSAPQATVPQTPAPIATPQTSTMFNPPPLATPPPVAIATQAVPEVSPFADASVTRETIAAASVAPVAPVASVEAVEEAKKPRGRPRKDTTPAAGEVDIAEVIKNQDAVEPKAATPSNTASFNLFIGCAPVKGSSRATVSIHDLLAPFIAQVEKDTGKYWGCVEFAQGRHLVASLLQQAHDSGKLGLAGKNVIAPAVAIETEIARTVLYSRAVSVIERAM